MPMTDAEILAKVKEALVEALSVDEDEITPQAKVTGDLGAESIDYLDIVFRLEKSFNIKIPRGDMLPDPSILNNPEIVQNNKVTPAGLAQIKEKYPHFDLSEFEKNPDINKMFDLFTVQAILNYVKTKVNG